MSHEVETMAYAHEVPWHGLGKSVSADLTVDQMASAAGLNWVLSPGKVFADLGGEITPITNKTAWYRNTDKKLMTMGSDNWRPMQPANVLGFFRDYVEAGGAHIETAGSLRGGSVIWALASLGKGFETSKGDRSNGYVLLTSQNKVGTVNSIRTTAIRVVCANTMAMAVAEGVLNYKQNHLSDFDISKAKETVELAHQSLAEAGARSKTLAKLKLSLTDCADVLADACLTGGRETLAGLSEDDYPASWRHILGATAKAPGATPGSGWGLMNGLTYWSDHMAGRDASARMFRSWLGDNDKLKLKVEARLMELAA